MFDAVIVGIEGYEAGRDAIALAKALLSRDGEVTFVYVEVLQSKPAPEADTRPDDEAQRFGLERLARLRDELHIAADVARIRAPSVRQGLHEFAAERGADLMVISASRRNRLEHRLLGNDVRELLEDPPCTVAVAPVGYSTRAAEMRKIGVAYEGSAESEHALALARRIAAEHGATLSAFEAVLPRLDPQEPWNMESEIEKDVNAARRRIAALGDVEPHAELAENAVDGLRRYGGSVDLLVVGAHSHRGREPKQSKAQRLAEGPPSPLLVLATTAAQRVGRRSQPSARV